VNLKSNSIEECYEEIIILAPLPPKATIEFSMVVPFLMEEESP
jgi:hypothetical protein